jgi:hypothetical protein
LRCSQGRNGFDQLDAVPERSDTKPLQVLVRQARQNRLVYVILAEYRLILPEGPGSAARPHQVRYRFKNPLWQHLWQQLTNFEPIRWHKEPEGTLPLQPPAGRLEDGSISGTRDTPLPLKVAEAAPDTSSAAFDASTFDAATFQTGNQLPPRVSNAVMDGIDAPPSAGQRSAR